MAANEDWRKNADTHKMSPEDVKRAGLEGSKRPPGQNPGGILHQRRSLPYSPMTMALIGLAITGSIAYFTLYSKKKPEATAGDVARVATNTADPADTRPRK
ncbi:OLC1v1020913C1 [Oldenlandia corymbosa var. corymbosa]|uniref:OLC1v1020913C1 n=1 Tax=Oldenlandia corymbosa var. corymbosa TaxID=529605 RepID=A0AAV1BWZ1_OLDCO|nr:OLC1v1020913C1 [Oldenlandia corymbosa var. corymbosa]